MNKIRSRPGPRTWGLLVLVALVVVLGLLFGESRDDNRTAEQGQPFASLPASSAAPAGSPAVTSPVRTPRATVDPESGLAWVEVVDLPVEAERTLDLIDRGGPFPYDKDGSRFNNFEGILPQEPRGFYQEYTVDTPGARDRGARRIVTGDNDQIFYWTADHYETFSRIRR